MSELSVPASQDAFHLRAKPDEIGDLFLQRLKLFPGEYVHSLAGRATGVPDFQDACKLGKRETNRQSAPHQPDALNRFTREPAIAGHRPRRMRQHTDAFVMAYRVGADARLPGNFTDSQAAGFFHS